MNNKFSLQHAHPNCQHSNRKLSDSILQIPKFNTGTCTYYVGCITKYTYLQPNLKCTYLSKSEPHPLTINHNIIRTRPHFFLDES